MDYKLENTERKYVAQSDDNDFEKTVKEMLMFRRIVEVERYNNQDGVLTLDNGTQLIVEGNRGCGGCGSGWYDLTELNGCDNAITNVKCECGSDGYEDIYNIFVYAEDKSINCVEYRGSDNGYYGTGYDLYVKVSEKRKGAPDNVEQSHILNRFMRQD